MKARLIIGIVALVILLAGGGIVFWLRSRMPQAQISVASQGSSPVVTQSPSVTTPGQGVSTQVKTENNGNAADANGDLEEGDIIYLSADDPENPDYVPPVTYHVPEPTHASAGGDAVIPTESVGTGQAPPENGSADDDGDGLTNDQEFQQGTDPRSMDTDGDGLSDGDEIRTYRTDPKKTDTDGDGLMDGDEIMHWKTDPLNPDTDHDGYSDGTEVKGGYNPRGTGKL